MATAARRKTPARRRATTAAAEVPPQTYNYPPPQQPNRLLYGLILLNILFSLFLFYKLQKPGTTSTGINAAAGTNANAPATDPSVALSVDSLKKDAKDLKLDANKFNKCLDNSEKKDAVAKDAQQGSSLGVNGTPGFFINGRFLAGAFPFENFKEIIDKELSGEANGTCDVYSDSLKSYCSTDGNNGFNPAPKDIDLGDAPMVGKQDAKVTLVEFSDFQCPFCLRAYPTIKKVLSTYPNDVKFYYKNLPLTQIHPYAQKAAEASECAKAQGKFWEYHDKLFESQGPPTS